MKLIIDSKYYDMCDVKKFNNFILSLKQISEKDKCKCCNFKEINEHIKIHRPYDELNKFVENSPSWMRLKLDYDKWDNAQLKLKELKHTSEQIMDEIYPTYLTIYKHTITIFHSNEELYSKYGYGVLEEFPEGINEETHTFYVKGYGGDVIEDWDSLLLPYYNDEQHNEKDLIQKACDHISWLNRVINVYKMADRIDCTYNDINDIFRISDLEFWSNGICTYYVIYDGKTYYDHQVKQLLGEYEIAKKLKYIHEDEYVKYPIFKPFLEFKKLLESGDYLSEINGYQIPVKD